jgi:exodeoxyribonuclease-3
MAQTVGTQRTAPVMKLRKSSPRVAMVVAFLLLAVSLGRGRAAELKVMSYNILVGGGGLGQPLSKTAEVISASGADIIGLQEQSGATASLAAMLGFHYTVQKSDISYLSRYPIVESLSSGVRIELPQGQDAYLFNVHLAAYPYQPYDIRDGLIDTEAEAIAGARAARGAAMDNVLSSMQAPLASGAPVFLVGDFNEPSHLDWTQEAADAGRHFGMKVAWPASTSVVNAGMSDTFRAIHPDEVARPGDTWTPLDAPSEVHDRIDLVYHAGQGIEPIDAFVVGEDPAQADLVITPYPSDHRAVVGRYQLLDVGGLTAVVDRGAGAVLLRNNSQETVTFDGYSLQSPGGYLDPSDDAWRSLADAGEPGWHEANPGPTRLSELNATGALTIAPGESVSLGRPYHETPTELGQPYIEDLRLRFFTPDGETLFGNVDFVGWNNNLVLLVDPSTGEAVLENQSPFEINFDSYRIASASGSLNVGDEGWISLAERAIDDWFEANPSAHGVAELHPQDASLLPSGARIRLGNLFALGGTPDLAMTFLLADESATRDALVLYEPFSTGCPDGDSNGDCRVDLADLNAVRNQFGEVGLGLAGDVNFDGTIDLADLNAVRNHFGEENTAVPEPSTIALAFCVGLAGAMVLRTRRASEAESAA